MTTALRIAAWVLLCLAALIAAGNVAILLTLWRCRRRGQPRSASMVLLFGLLFCLASLAFRALAHATSPPTVLIAAVILLDPATWSLLWLPFFLILEAIRRE